MKSKKVFFFLSLTTACHKKRNTQQEWVYAIHNNKLQPDWKLLPSPSCINIKLLHLFLPCVLKCQPSHHPMCVQRNCISQDGGHGCRVQPRCSPQGWSTWQTSEVWTSGKKVSLIPAAKLNIATICTCLPTNSSVTVRTSAFSRMNEWMNAWIDPSAE